MYLLDTVTLSELRKIPQRRAHQNVQQWVASVAITDLWLSVITVQEITTGYLLKRAYDPIQANFLEAWVAHTLAEFRERILTIDIAVAQQCAALHAQRTLPERDALIAATALVHNLTVVTRNVRDFHDTGVQLINAWQ